MPAIILFSPKGEKILEDALKEALPAIINQRLPETAEKITAKDISVEIDSEELRRSSDTDLKNATQIKITVTGQSRDLVFKELGDLFKNKGILKDLDRPELLKIVPDSRKSFEKIFETLGVGEKFQEAIKLPEGYGMNARFPGQARMEYAIDFPSAYAAEPALVRAAEKNLGATLVLKGEDNYSLIIPYKPELYRVENGEPFKSPREKYAATLVELDKGHSDPKFAAKVLADITANIGREDALLPDKKLELLGAEAKAATQPSEKTVLPSKKHAGRGIIEH